jgi:hypothetical protein
VGEQPTHLPKGENTMPKGVNKSNIDDMPISELSNEQDSFMGDDNSGSESSLSALSDEEGATKPKAKKTYVPKLVFDGE